MNEGKATINYNKDFLNNLSSKLPVFYNPLMKINRDFTILLLKSYYDIYNKKIDILDCMSATGIRSIRIIKEIPQIINKIYINDIKKEAIENIKENLRINNIEIGENILLENQDCRSLLLRNKYDYIDIDPFGSPIGFVELTPQALRNNGILGVTATDISALSGSKSKAAYRKYNIIGIKTDFYLEFGLRALIKYVILEGLKYYIGLKPIFGYYYKHHYRVFFIKNNKSNTLNYLSENIKYINYCKNCGYKSFEEETCKICGNKMIKLGPIYAGNMYDEEFLKKINENKNIIDLDKDEKKIMDRIISCDSKIDLPYYYDIRKISSFYKKDLPKLEYILDKNNGCRTHFSDYGIKTLNYPQI
ncbi:tRNA (guanine(26)-N(2)/guanine(27)-N(2))-dimethyltransferase [Nanobdella aerobiophila]|uniref:tRNA (guanine(26)-N(2))-dimethyltransferase n=1 Tax=Nanobdella aerobiophila TaxID=2586965 RepID=A0A915SK21_9ARCH|nr:N2,N2-dimethylguanosine tRNA methyltransferase [Nanobdella aerobiophila]BBL45383.1 tRNA (guanine(26)-N(2)/guanine(27)-N(2))-dimethyltransferase [Nanobdella aerobiophila]